MSTANVLFDAPGPKARRRHAIIGGVAIALVAAIGIAVVWALREQLLDPNLWAPMVEPLTWWAYLVPGLWKTLQAAALAVVASGILGLVLASMRMSHVRVLSVVGGTLIEVMRAIPVLMMMLFWYFALRRFVGGDALALSAVVMGLTLYNAAVIAELIRSGVRSLPKGQREAASALGLTRPQTMRLILMPQAITAMLPALVSQLVVVLKDSALGYMIGYSELMRSAQNLATNKGNFIVVFLVTALIYIAINAALTGLARVVEDKVRNRTSGTTVRKMQVNVAAATETAKHDVPRGTHGL